MVSELRELGLVAAAVFAGLDTYGDKAKEEMNGEELLIMECRIHIWRSR